MPHPLTIIGIIHTIIGIVALVFAFIALARFGKIDPRKGPGKWYFIFTILASVSSFAVMKTGSLSPAHLLSVLILLLLPLGFLMNKTGTRAEYVGTLAMTFTLFLSFVPTITETLTRVPFSQPIAVDQDDPVLKKILGTLLIVFVAGMIYQVRKIKAGHKSVYKSHGFTSEMV